MTIIETLRPALSGIGAAASLANGFLFVTAANAEGQNNQPTSAPADKATALPPVEVDAPVAKRRRAPDAGAKQASRPVSASHPSKPAEPRPQAASSAVSPGNSLQRTTGLSRLSDSLQSTPQTVTVIPRLVIEQQQAATINQVLQYVPGITVATGEGGGGINGDQFRIRGFDASGDVYVDGLRDFGSYVRDSFATENVLVLKGPSSQSFGNGTTGGVIEIESKKAHLGDQSTFEASAGTGPYGRGILDINKQINDTTALRFIAMGNGQDIVDRDHVYSDRGGFLGSLGLGLGTEQSLIVNYMHQQSVQRPDFGVPIVSAPGVVGKPVTEYGVPRSNYFGRESDRDRATADVATALYKGEFGDWLTLTNDTRVGYYTRDLKFTPALCASPGFPFPSSCATDVLAGNLATPYTIWSVGGTKQVSHGGENVTTATMRFDTGPFRHKLVAGFDVYSQHATTNFYLPSGPEPAGTLLDPIFANSPGFALTVSPGNQLSATSWDVGPFISDRMWLTPMLSILTGVRWDHYRVDGQAGASPLATTSEFASPKASLIFEPTTHQSYYFSYARSFTPPGNNITSLSSSLGLSQAPSAANLQPEADTTFEVGAKWGLFEDQLGVTAALFRVEKNNASYTDQVSGIQTTTDDKVQVQGVELGLTGKLTANWDVQASYSYMDSKIIASSISPFTPVSAAGNRVPYVSQHGLAIWTTYDIAPLLPNVPGHMLVGGGLNYRSDYYLNNLNSMVIPAATTIDGMLSYDPNERHHLAFKVTNLTNKLTYSSAFGNGYATPVAGRSVTLTAAIRF
ncbi:TonB-dependent siderophore receptor [Bradyrhizobium huanghuaihaiense]|uniref:TonB-dependent receptor n=1 Tax=Bradyrhizobium huanghuaihaiense TaxID=990078 RepID=UPI0021AA69B0|nr:TonB-dependent siderophore receptor [Bradyrhizobium sp. CB3035]UWU80532.1 TonB-dependent siderophore receptor [Bradyrhizobium sp. CB3035]